MAVLEGPLAYTRRVALRGDYTITCYRGQLVASAWPRRHLFRPKKTELARRQYMQDMVVAIKYADAGTYSDVQDIVGGSPVLARDFMFMLIAGTGFFGYNEEGKKILPIRYQRILFKALDRIQREPGGPTARHTQRWITTPPGSAGTRYTSNGPDQLPSWT